MILLGFSAPDTEDHARKPCLIYPNDTWKVMGWDLTISVLLLVTCMTTPFDLAFSQEIQEVYWYQVVRNTIDVLFSVDIFIIFNTAFQNEIQEIEDDRCVIATTYLKGWFFIDLMAVIPFETLISFVMNAESTDSDRVDYNKFIRISRMSKLYKLIKITRLLRLLKLMKK